MIVRRVMGRKIDPVVDVGVGIDVDSLHRRDQDDDHNADDDAQEPGRVFLVCHVGFLFDFPSSCGEGVMVLRSGGAVCVRVVTGFSVVTKQKGRFLAEPALSKFWRAKEDKSGYWIAELLIC